MKAGSTVTIATFSATRHYDFIVVSGTKKKVEPQTVFSRINVKKIFIFIDTFIYLCIDRIL